MLSTLRFLDLSHPLVDGAAAYPGDPDLRVIARGTIATHQFNVSQVIIGTHQGTHLDAMFHFYDDGRTLDQMPLDWFYGPARVLRLPRQPDQEITDADLGVFEAHLTPGAKIVLDTGWHRRFGTPSFFDAYPSLTLDAARYLVSRRIRLLGMDMPSPGKPWLELHHILLAREAEVVLVESLARLDALPDQFIFAGFPLNLAGRDGSPIRAVAIF
jgi:kynurenine formamidase